MRFNNAVTAAGLILAAAACGPILQAQAQTPGGGPPPEMMAKIKAWQKWGETHKNLSNLQTMLFQIHQMDQDPATRLTKPQAAKLLGVMRTWQSRPTMSDDQAKQVSKQIGALLNERQLKKMTTMQPPWARRGGMGGGGMGGMRPGGGMGGMRPGGGMGGGMRPGGGMGAGRPGGGPGGFRMPDPPKGGYNPFNASTLPFARMRPQAQRAQQEFMAQLQQRAKG